MNNLERLIEVARKRGDRIVAVNDDHTAYCPVTGICYYERESGDDMVPLASSDPARLVWRVDDGDLIKLARKHADPDVLADESYLMHWITLEGDEVCSYDAGVGSGCCADSGTWYDALDLPEDVRPLEDPLGAGAARWDKAMRERFPYYDAEIQFCLQYGFPWDPLGATEFVGTVNEPASVRKLMDVLQERLRQAFPGAAVDVRYSNSAGTSDIHVSHWRHSPDREAEMRERIDDVWSATLLDVDSWVVPGDSDSTEDE